MPVAGKQKVLKAVLAVVNKWEESGKLFFNRNSDNSMSVFIRDPRLWGGNPNIEHWANARAVEAQLLKAGGRITRGIEIDKMSGNLVITVDRVYS